jgi:glycine dehydrogenase subunit 1
MPGRLVGRTSDADGSDAFVLTLATREQHIRREKATSNICSNHALNALAAGVYLAAVGGEGLADIAGACVTKAHYFRDRLLATGRFSAPWDAPFAHEFALHYKGDSMAMQAEMLQRGFFAGVRALAHDAEWPALRAGAADELDQLVIFAVTEKRTRAEMDAFAEEVSSL